MLKVGKGATSAYGRMLSNAQQANSDNEDAVNREVDVGAIPLPADVYSLWQKLEESVRRRNMKLIENYASELSAIFMPADETEEEAEEDVTSDIEES